MKRTIFLFLIFSVCNAFSQDPIIQWQRCYGGTNDDVANCIVEVADGGYVIVGYTESNNINVSGNHSVGISDVWVIKIDNLGTLQWQKCLGGTSSDVANTLRITSDSGLIIVGRSSSDDGDVTGNHFGSDDYWIVKTDLAGNIQWQNSFGGSEDDEAIDICMTDDQGYVISGTTSSIDGDVQNNIHGTADDYWILKLDSNRAIQWQRALGGSFYDYGYNVVQTANHGYSVTGWLGSDDYDVTCGHGSSDIWIVNLDSLGIIEDQFCFGATSEEELGRCIFLKNGFLLGGTTTSNDGDVSGNHGYADLWLAKSDSNGNVLWSKCYGGLSNEECFAIDTTSDHGAILAGRSNSNDSLVQNHGFGLDDIYVVKADSNGSPEWDINLGGTNEERANSVIQTRDGGYVVAGWTTSTNGDVSGSNGGKDFWVVKLAPIGLGVNYNELNSEIIVRFNDEKNLQLDFYSKSEEDITVNLFDITGKIVLYEKRKKQIGQNLIELETSNLNIGIYFVTVNSNQTSFSKKLILNR